MNKNIVGIAVFAVGLLLIIGYFALQFQKVNITAAYIAPPGAWESGTYFNADHGVCEFRLGTQLSAYHDCTFVSYVIYGTPKLIVIPYILLFAMWFVYQK
jgi:hypothetical protein